jgi:uncharacterized membrane protein
LKENYEIRAQARQTLTNNWVNPSLALFLKSLTLSAVSFIFVIIIYIAIFAFMITLGIYSESQNNFQTTDLAFGIITFLVFTLIYIFAILLMQTASQTIRYGICNYFLKLSRGENVNIEDIFITFKKFILSLKTGFLLTFFIGLWGLLFFIPGIIASLRYSMTHYILLENPHLSSMEAIDRSKQITSGYLGKIFMMYLSFFGWSVLAYLGALITCGIGGLVTYNVLGTYIHTSMAIFYQDLVDKNEVII